MARQQGRHDPIKAVEVENVSMQNEVLGVDMVYLSGQIE
jgi:hypothetical protein